MSDAIVYTLLPAQPAAPAALTESEALAASYELLTFSDVAWDFDTNDLVTPKRVIRGVDVIVQNLRFKLQTFLGTWFLDLNAGLPERRIYGVGVDPRIVREIFTKAVLTTPGLVRLENLEVSIDNLTRRASIGEFRGILGTGQALVLQPFVIGLPPSKPSVTNG